jgi:Transmembrane protein 43
MADRYTEVTRNSWGSRIKNTFVGVLIGIILFLGSFFLVWWNEGNSINRENDLKQGNKDIISVKSDIPLPGNENKLVHLSGKVETADTLIDSEFGTTANAIALSRKVLIYQWVEKTTQRTEKELGGSERVITQYDYTKQWVSEPNNSSEFKIQEGHLNKCDFPYRDTITLAQNVKVGSFDLTAPLLYQIDKFEDYAIDSTSFDDSFMISSNTIYLGSEIINDDPEIGDMKISFQVAYAPEMVSIIAQQVNGTLSTYVGENDTEIVKLAYGTVSADNMIKLALEENGSQTWILRGLGILFCIIGLLLILKPLSVIMDVLPILGSITNFGTVILSVILGLILMLTTISIAWLFYRPILSISLFAVIVPLFIYLYRRGKKKDTTMKLS